MADIVTDYYLRVPCPPPCWTCATTIGTDLSVCNTSRHFSRIQSTIPFWHRRLLTTPGRETIHKGGEYAGQIFGPVVGWIDPTKNVRLASGCHQERAFPVSFYCFIVRRAPSIFLARYSYLCSIKIKETKEEWVQDKVVQRLRGVVTACGFNPRLPSREKEAFSFFRKIKLSRSKWTDITPDNNKKKHYFREILSTWHCQLYKLLREKKHKQKWSQKLFPWPGMVKLSCSFLLDHEDCART